MERTRAYRRHVRHVKIQHRANELRNWWGSWFEEIDQRPLGRLDDIHDPRRCSCALCDPHKDVPDNPKYTKKAVDIDDQLAN